MAKAKKTKKKKVEEKHVVVPPLPTGIVNIPFTREELATFASLMSICAQTFENLAIQAAAQNDDTASTVLSARHKLSNMYAARLIESFSMGEPESRDVH